MGNKPDESRRNIRYNIHTGKGQCQENWFRFFVRAERFALNFFLRVIRVKRRRFVRVSSLKEGMCIDQAIIDKMGRKLIVRGTELNAYLIEGLQKLNITGVYIVEGEDEPEEKVSPKAKANISRYSVPDRAKVQLSESVKKRVSEGIQYLYNDTESDDFVQTTNGIADDLMRAITENDAVAVDIETLKVCDEYTFTHCVDVATMSMVIAKRYGLSDRQIHEIGIAGLLHDVGKSMIPNEVLNKAGKLNDEEFSIMREHARLGYNLLMEKKDVPEEIALGVLQHHEKINGMGYPLGLAGDEITLYAKIISVADIYDALVTERPYKKPMSKRDAVEMIMALTNELDITALKSFLDSVILYPVGCEVKLSNGENAQVVENNDGYILRPKVVGLSSGRLYDLAGDLTCASIVIE